MLSSRLEILVACRNCWKQHHYLFSWSSALTKPKPKLSLQNSSATVLLYSFWDWSPRWGWPQILASVLSASAGRGLKAGIASITSESSEDISPSWEHGLWGVTRLWGDGGLPAVRPTCQRPWVGSPWPGGCSHHAEFHRPLLPLPQLFLSSSFNSL